MAPFAASGPVRTLTGLSIGWALVIAVAATFALVWRLRIRRRADASKREGSWIVSVALALPAMAAVAVLYNRHFGGAVVLASSGIPDAGNHVVQQHLFVTSLPTAYLGFDSLYAVVEWLKRWARCDDFQAFMIATYVPIAVYASFGVAAAATAVERFAAQPRARTAGVVAASAWSLALLAVTLPQLHYHHAQGFFPPIFGLLPLLALWLSDAILRTPTARLVAFVPLIALYRYTYGLNLPDLLIACAVMRAIDARATRSSAARALLLVVAVATLIAAWQAIRLLRVEFRHPGPFDAYALRRVLIGQWLLIATIGGACFLPQTQALLRGSGIARWVRLPIAFAFLNALFLTVVDKPPSGPDYYYLKTNLHPLLLLLISSVVVVSALISGAFAATGTPTARTHWVHTGMATLLLSAGVATVGSGFSRYWPSFLQRAFGSPPYPLLKPLSDRFASRRIGRVLAEHHARFGGYLTSYYPIFNFMNASFGYWNGGISFYLGAPPAEQPGYCVFWEGGPPESRIEPIFRHASTCERLSRDPRRTCVGYHPSWNPEGYRTLCWICP